MLSPNDYPDSHPGWDRLLDGMARQARRHPLGPADPLRDVALEIVTTFRGARHPALRAVVDALHDALTCSKERL